MTYWYHCEICGDLYPPVPGKSTCPECGNEDINGVEL